MSNSAGRGRGRGHNRAQNGPVKTVGGSSASSTISSASDSMPTLTTRQVFEAAAASGKEFVPRTGGSSALTTTVNARVFVPRSSATSSSPGIRHRHEPQHPSNHYRSNDHGASAPSRNGGRYYNHSQVEQRMPQPDYGTTPHESDALRKVEQLVNNLLVNPWCLESDFDEVKVALNRSIVSEQAMFQLCSYLIQVGWSFESFSYPGSRFVHLLDVNLNNDGVLGTFRSVFLRVLQDSYATLPEVAADPAQRPLWLNFSIFFAEVYRNLLITNPGATSTHSIKALSAPLIENVRSLMLQPGDDTMQCACRILKLTGSYLQLDARDTLLMVTEGLRLIPKQTLSASTTRLIESVLDLEKHNWGMAADSVVHQSPVYISTSDPLASVQQDMAASQPQYATASHQEPLSVDVLTQSMASSSLQPVTNPDMWNEYADPEDEGEDDDDIALQRDMEEEYAHFLRDIEGIEDA